MVWLVPRFNSKLFILPPQQSRDDVLGAVLSRHNDSDLMNHTSHETSISPPSRPAKS